MPRVNLHGAQISWSFDATPPDPLATILEPFGPFLDESGAPPPDVVLRLHEAPLAAAAPPDHEGYAPAFFLGIIQAYRGAPPDPRPLLFWDRASRVHVPLDGSPMNAFIAPPHREVTPGTTSAMLQAAIALALRRHSFFHLHAAAVVHPSGAPILIAGSSGAGKTTTAITLLELGCSYLGDESLFLRPSNLLAFPRTFHVGPATLAAFPRLAPLSSPRLNQPSKLVLDPCIAWPHRARLTSLPPSLALFPSVTSSPSTTLTKIPPPDALGHLIASSAAIFLPGVPGRDENLAILHHLAETTPSYELHLGRDLLQSPTDVLSRILPHVLL